MYCMHCGKSVPDKAKFCPECGKNLSPSGTKNDNLTTTIQPTKKKKRYIVLKIFVALVVVIFLVTLTATISRFANPTAKMIANNINISYDTAYEIVQIFNECQLGKIITIKPSGTLETHSDYSYNVSTDEVTDVLLEMTKNEGIYLIEYDEEIFYQLGKVTMTLAEYKMIPYITMEEYNKIQTGMSYDEVVEIVGSAGEVSSSSTAGGYSVSIITWYGDNYSGANANVTFTNGEVTGKAQAGLK